jgi:probable F420-dependent oxidoreductase
VLVAKQAAEVDVLSQGRFRLGVGLGWNEVEYQALNENFHNRGRRLEEQIEVLRRLFTEESVTYQGRWHQIAAAGLNPLPVQRPIPIWLGGSVEATLRRVAALGDGWFPQMPPERARDAVERLRAYAREAGRDPATIGIEGRLSIAGTNPEDWARTVEAWKALGANYLAVNTMGAGLATPQDHINAIRRFREAIAGVV